MTRIVRMHTCLLRLEGSICTAGGGEKCWESRTKKDMHAGEVAEEDGSAARCGLVLDI